MSDAELLSIGRFARACRLSIKALRHYDEVDLLKPARVDATGYRFYTRAQAKIAISISLLRSLDVPLLAIKAILDAEDSKAIVSRLDTERRRLERDIARSRQALSCVERMMRDGQLLAYEVNLRQEPETTLLSVETTTTPELHVASGFATFERLKVAVERAGLGLREPIVCILPEPPDDDTMILRMCTPAPADVDASTLAEHGIAIERIPRGRVAFTTHRGSYDEIGLAQHSVIAWIHQRGHTPSGPPREVYLDDPGLVPEADRRTELIVPIRD